MILYIMLCGKPPFRGSEEVKKGELDFKKHEIWHSISEEAKDLVSKLMDRDVNTRLTAVEALAHPWIAKTRSSYNKDLAQKAISNLAAFKVSLETPRSMNFRKNESHLRC